LSAADLAGLAAHAHRTDVRAAQWGWPCPLCPLLRLFVGGGSSCVRDRQSPMGVGGSAAPRYKTHGSL
jgi:hypothetical protein